MERPLDRSVHGRAVAAPSFQYIYTDYDSRHVSQLGYSCLTVTGVIAEELDAFEEASWFTSTYLVSDSTIPST